MTDKVLYKEGARYRVRVDEKAQLAGFATGMRFRQSYFVSAEFRDNKFATVAPPLSTPEFEGEDIPSEYIMEVSDMSSQR
ncbi:MAG: hypothetical protein WC119_02770 [Synergistaceae bacterium]